MSTSSYALITEVSKILMQGEGGPAVDPGAKLRADLVELDPLIRVGEPTTLTLDVTNLGQVIRAFRVSVLGLDPTNVEVDPPVLELFPWERQSVTLTLTLPLEQPAGAQRLAVEVVEPGHPTVPPAVVEFSVEVEGRPGLTVSAEPATLEMGGSGVFVVHLTNTGNTEMAVDLEAQDPERLVDVVFEPAKPILQPGERAVVKAKAKGPRPWFGSPAVRVLDVEAEAQGITALSVLALLQRPRIGRRLIAFLGMLMVVTLFAYVISQSFGQVARLAEQNQALVQQGLGFEDETGARADPSDVAGKVLSSTGAGIDGATVRLFDEGDLVQPVHTTVTDETGAYQFGAVADGTYLLQTEAAGFGSTWYDGAPTFEGATPIEVAGENTFDGLDLRLTGQPGSVEGLVVGTDVEGAVVAVRLPAEAVTGSALPAVAAVVAAIEIDATGIFVLPDLATPAEYELAVSKPGFATEIRAITLKAGEQRQNIEVLLRPGIGLISGVVTDTEGRPLGGVEIRASDGTSESTTRSLSDNEAPGRFDLRDLATPGSYTVTFTAQGFLTETVTIELVAEQQRTDVSVLLTSATGTLRGRVNDPSGQPLGGVVVTVTGPDVERVTQSLTRTSEDNSKAGPGTWEIDALPAPGSYTVRFESPGYRATSVSVQLVAGLPRCPPEQTTLCTNVPVVALRFANSVVHGLVENANGTGATDVRVTLESSELERTTRSSDETPGDPDRAAGACESQEGAEPPSPGCPVAAGTYVFDRVPAGTYTLTFTRTGSTPQTLIIEVPVGGNPVKVDTVVLEEQALIRGFVTRDGARASDIGVRVYRAGDYPEGLVASTVTSTGGSFEFIGLDAPEGYVIDFEVPAGGEVTRSLTVFLQPREARDLGEVKV